MHDGYLFTLGVCGSASDSGPAPACLDGMLAALPPVKRAAYLGEILLSEGAPSLDDPLTAPLLADIADAELLLIVTPLPGGALPARLLGLARALEAAPPAGERLAAIVTVGEGADTALRPLRLALARAGATIVGELRGHEAAGMAEIASSAAGLARAAYAMARERNPGALP
jgi:hypothetical protein